MKVRSIVLPKIINRKGHSSEIQALLTAQLSPQLKFWYIHSHEDWWLPLSEYASFISIAAQTVFPDHPHQAHRLGRAEMKIIIRMEAVQKMKQVVDAVQGLKIMATLWNRFFNQGQMEIKKTKQGANIRIAAVPPLPAVLREYFTGYLEEGLQAIVNRPLRVKAGNAIPDVWSWDADWESPQAEMKKAAEDCKFDCV